MGSNYEKNVENGSSLWWELCKIKDGHKFFGTAPTRWWGQLNFSLNGVNLWLLGPKVHSWTNAVVLGLALKKG